MNNQFSSDIPQGWQKIRLGRVANLNPSKQEIANLSDDTKVTFLPMESVSESWEVDYSRIRLLEEVRNGYTYFRDGDILLAKITPCFENGKGALVNSCTNGVGFGTTEFHVIRSPDLATASFLSYVVRSHRFKVEGEGMMTGAAGQKRVPDSYIKNFEIYLPPREVRGAIALFLDRKTAAIDTLIAKKQRLIQLLEEKRTALINQAVTKGLNPDVPMKDSGIPWIGKIPEHWEIRKLKYLSIKIGSGITPKGGASTYLKEGIPLIRSQNVRINNLLMEDVAFISEEVHNLMKNSQVKPGDILLNITGASIGRCAIVPIEITEANVNQHVCIIRVNQKIIPEYCNAFFTSEKGQHQIFSGEQGVSREGLNFEQLKNFLITFPPKNEQLDIENVISREFIRSERIIRKIQEEINLLNEYRQSLITAAVTGKIDISQEEAA
jgi:type I restriction enzyme S subunit